MRQEEKFKCYKTWRFAPTRKNSPQFGGQLLGVQRCSEVSKFSKFRELSLKNAHKISVSEKMTFKKMCKNRMAVLGQGWLDEVGGGEEGSGLVHLPPPLGCTRPKIEVEVDVEVTRPPPTHIFN